MGENGEFIIFNLKNGQIAKQIKFETHYKEMIHPTTYINKLLFADDTKIDLWNVIDNNLIYTFKNISESESRISLI